MRIISLCVDGIHQAAQRGLYDWLADQDADIICLQDLRAQEYELDGDPFQLEGYFAYFFDSGIKHYNGVAIYTRQQPKALIYGLGFNTGVDMEGRYLQVDFEQISVGSLLAPSARAENESCRLTCKKSPASVASLSSAATGRWRTNGKMCRTGRTTTVCPAFCRTNNSG
jgi:exodeoxyribonuclease-3